MQSKETTSELSNRDKAFLKLAIAAAETSECRQKHGAVLVSGGSVLAIGINKTRNHPDVLGTGRFSKYREFADIYGTSYHAEMDAIRGIFPVTCSRAVLYVARVNKLGEPRYSRPCNKCYPVLMSYGIKEVVYTLNG